MFSFAKEFGSVAIAFYISNIIIGQMIFLNLFLAMVLDNFDIHGDEDVDGILE